MPEGQVRGIIQIAHGIAEHIGRYEDFMAFLAANGFAAVANDHLGHGETSKNNVEKLGCRMHNKNGKICKYERRDAFLRQTALTNAN